MTETVSIPFFIGGDEMQQAFDSLPGAIMAANQNSKLGDMVANMHRKAVGVVSGNRVTRFNRNRLDRPGEAMKFGASTAIPGLIVNELNACRNAPCGFAGPTKVSLSDVSLPRLSDVPVTLGPGVSKTMMVQNHVVSTADVEAFRQAQDAIRQTPITGKICLDCVGNRSSNPGCRFQK